MSLNVQLAIQGGGAKIVALMATMEAVDALQEEGKLTVTRIAGTSAGALVGSIYAVGPGAIKEARIRLRQLTDKDIRKLFPSPFSVRRSFRLTKLLLMGHPLWSTSEIENFLSTLLRNGSQSFQNIVHLKHPKCRNIELKIVATNLSAYKKELLEGDDPLIASLMHSAGLPFCFRTWSKSGSPVIVDGGICENLPSDELDQPNEVKKFGRVVGVSFKPPKPTPIDNIARFSVSLLETAMQNSMQRARQRLGEEYLHDIDTTIGTFEFEKALDRLRDERGEYDLIRNEAHEWFSDYVEREEKARVKGSQVLVGDPWGSQGLSMMDKLGEVYKAHHADRQRNLHQCSLVVTAKCLLKEGSADFGQPDILRYSTKFNTKSETIYCQRINVTGTLHGSRSTRTQWSCRDLTDDNRVIKFVDLPMRSMGAKPGKDRELLLFFDPPLDPNSGPYEFEFEDLVTDFMKPLSMGEEDDIFFMSSRAQGIIRMVDLILFVPIGTPYVKITPRNGSPGRQMNSKELAKYGTVLGFRAMGWTATNVPGGTEVGIIVRLEQSTS